MNQTTMIIWLEKKRFKQEPESILFWKWESLSLMWNNKYDLEGGG